MNRRELMALAAGGALAGVARRAVAAEPKLDGGLAWYDVQSWGVEGKGWSDTARYYDRLPSRAEGKVRPPVWSLSRQSAGMLARFETNATAIHVRYSLLSSGLALPHMPATGVSGIDLYARDDRGRDRWLGVARPTAQKVEAQLASGIDPAPEGRLYTVYLPLYNGVDTVEIGVAPGSSFRPAAPRREPPILFYGTSIMQGACASRPGMAFSSILGRRFDRPVINLGFSGNGMMEPEVASLLAELDPCVYAIDCLPNMGAELVSQRAAPLVRALRAAHPETPILLVEDRTFSNARFLKSAREGHEARRAALRKAFEELTGSGIRGLAYMQGDRLIGEDGEGATDGSHPNDLGMVRYADAYERALRPLIKEERR